MNNVILCVEFNIVKTNFRNILLYFDRPDKETSDRKDRSKAGDDSKNKDTKKESSDRGRDAKKKNRDSSTDSSSSRR